MTTSVEPWRALVKSHEAAILSEAATFDMGHDTGAFSLSGLYSSIYNGALYQHTTSGDEKALAKETLHDLLCRHRGLRRVYAPIFAMLAAAGEGRSYAPDERDCRAAESAAEAAAAESERPGEEAVMR